MKVCVMNFSGNVGKTVVAAHLMAPRLEAKIYSVETLNVGASADGVEVESMSANQFQELFDELAQAETAVVDVGTSNVQTFMKLMQRFAGSHEDIDMFLIPTVKVPKQQADTINTVRALIEIGVPANKIRLVFNMVEPEDNIDYDFAPVIATANSLGVVAKPFAAIHTNEVFDIIKGSGRNLPQILADDTDYRAQIRVAGEADKPSLLNKLAAQRLAKSCSKNLDAAYAALRPQ